MVLSMVSVVFLSQGSPWALYASNPMARATPQHVIINFREYLYITWSPFVLWSFLRYCAWAYRPTPCQGAVRWPCATVFGGLLYVLPDAADVLADHRLAGFARKCAGKLHSGRGL